MDISKEFQMSDVKLTTEQCEDFYNTWKNPECNIKWIIDSPVGAQVVEWVIARARKGLSTKKVNTQFVPFISPVDGTEISCKRGLREHERKHGIRQVGDDIKLKGESND